MTSPSSSPPPPFTIHHLHISQSERIVWLAEELNLTNYTLKQYTRAPFLSPPELLALTPQGSAPVLTSTTPSGKTFNMTESNAIAEYLLSDLYNPSRKLVLKPTDEEYNAYVFWLHFANGSLQPALHQQITAGHFDPTGTHPVYQRVVDRVGKSLKALDDRLKETKAWLAGAQFTAADVMNVWCVTNMRQFTPVDLSPYEGILAWLSRVAEREAYQRAMTKAEEGLDWKKGLTAEGPGFFPPMKALREQRAAQGS